MWSSFDIRDLNPLSWSDPLFAQQDQDISRAEASCSQEVVAHCALAPPELATRTQSRLTKLFSLPLKEGGSLCSRVLDKLKEELPGISLLGHGPFFKALLDEDRPTHQGPVLLSLVLDLTKCSSSLQQDAAAQISTLFADEPSLECKGSSFSVEWSLATGDTKKVQVVLEVATTYEEIKTKTSGQALVLNMHEPLCVDFREEAPLSSASSLGLTGASPDSCNSIRERAHALRALLNAIPADQQQELAPVISWLAQPLDRELASLPIELGGGIDIQIQALRQSFILSLFLDKMSAELAYREESSWSPEEVEAAIGEDLTRESPAPDGIPVHLLLLLDPPYEHLLRTFLQTTLHFPCEQATFDARSAVTHLHQLETAWNTRPSPQAGLAWSLAVWIYSQQKDPEPQWGMRLAYGRLRLESRGEQHLSWPRRHTGPLADAASLFRTLHSQEGEQLEAACSTHILLNAPESFSLWHEVLTDFLPSKELLNQLCFEAFAETLPLLLTRRKETVYEEKHVFRLQRALQLYPLCLNTPEARPLHEAVAALCQDSSPLEVLQSLEAIWGSNGLEHSRPSPHAGLAWSLAVWMYTQQKDPQAQWGIRLAFGRLLIAQDERVAPQWPTQRHGAIREVAGLFSRIELNPQENLLKACSRHLMRNFPKIFTHWHAFLSDRLELTELQALSYEALVSTLPALIHDCEQHHDEKSSLHRLQAALALSPLLPPDHPLEQALSCLNSTFRSSSHEQTPGSSSEVESSFSDRLDLLEPLIHSDHPELRQLAYSIGCRICRRSHEACEALHENAACRVAYWGLLAGQPVDLPGVEGSDSSAQKPQDLADQLLSWGSHLLAHQGQRSQTRFVMPWVRLMQRVSISCPRARAAFVEWTHRLCPLKRGACSSSGLPIEAELLEAILPDLPLDAEGAYQLLQIEQGRDYIPALLPLWEALLSRVQKNTLAADLLSLLSSADGLRLIPRPRLKSAENPSPEERRIEEVVHVIFKTLCAGLRRQNQSPRKLINALHELTVPLAFYSPSLVGEWMKCLFEQFSPEIWSTFQSELLERVLMRLDAIRKGAEDSLLPQRLAPHELSSALKQLMQPIQLSSEGSQRAQSPNRPHADHAFKTICPLHLSSASTSQLMKWIYFASDSPLFAELSDPAWERLQTRRDLLAMSAEELSKLYGYMQQSLSIHPEAVLEIAHLLLTSGKKLPSTLLEGLACVCFRMGEFSTPNSRWSGLLSMLPENAPRVLYQALQQRPSGAECLRSLEDVLAAGADDHLVMEILLQHLSTHPITWTATELQRLLFLGWSTRSSSHRIQLLAYAIDQLRQPTLVEQADIICAGWLKDLAPPSEEEVQQHLEGPGGSAHGLDLCSVLGTWAKDQPSFTVWFTILQLGSFLSECHSPIMCDRMLESMFQHVVIDRLDERIDALGMSMRGLERLLGWLEAQHSALSKGSYLLFTHALARIAHSCLHNEAIEIILILPTVWKMLLQYDLKGWTAHSRPLFHGILLILRQTPALLKTPVQNLQRTPEFLAFLQNWTSYMVNDSSSPLAPWIEEGLQRIDNLMNGIDTPAELDPLAHPQDTQVIHSLHTTVQTALELLSRHEESLQEASSLHMPRIQLRRVVAALQRMNQHRKLSQVEQVVHVTVHLEEGSPLELCVGESHPEPCSSSPVTAWISCTHDPLLNVVGGATLRWIAEQLKAAQIKSSPKRRQDAQDTETAIALIDLLKDGAASTNARGARTAFLEAMLLAIRQAPNRVSDDLLRCYGYSLLLFCHSEEELPSLFRHLLPHRSDILREGIEGLFSGSQELENIFIRWLKGLGVALLVEWTPMVAAAAPPHELQSQEEQRRRCIQSTQTWCKALFNRLPLATFNSLSREVRCGLLRILLFAASNPTEGEWATDLLRSLDFTTLRTPAVTSLREAAVDPHPTEASRSDETAQASTSSPPQDSLSPLAESIFILATLLRNLRSIIIPQNCDRVCGQRLLESYQLIAMRISEQYELPIHTVHLMAIQPAYCFTFKLSRHYYPACEARLKALGWKGLRFEDPNALAPVNPYELWTSLFTADDIPRLTESHRRILISFLHPDILFAIGMRQEDQEIRKSATTLIHLFINITHVIAHDTYDNVLTGSVSPLHLLVYSNIALLAERLLTIESNLNSAALNMASNPACAALPLTNHLTIMMMFMPLYMTHRHAKGLSLLPSLISTPYRMLNDPKFQQNTVFFDTLASQVIHEIHIAVKNFTDRLSLECPRGSRSPEMEALDYEEGLPSDPSIEAHLNYSILQLAREHEAWNLIPYTMFLLYALSEPTLTDAEVEMLQRLCSTLLQQVCFWVPRTSVQDASLATFILMCHSHEESTFKKILETLQRALPEDHIDRQRRLQQDRLHYFARSPFESPATALFAATWGREHHFFIQGRRAEPLMQRLQVVARMTTAQGLLFPQDAIVPSFVELALKIIQQPPTS